MERAVSEVVGYIYIFGIVMMVLSIVFVQVNSMVEDMKRSVLSQSLEQSFRRIQYIIYSVAFGDVPAQVAEIELRGGAMKLNKEMPEFIIAFVNETINGSCSDILRSENFVLHCLNLSTAKIQPYEVQGCSGAYDRPACVFNRTAGELRYEYKDWFLSVEAGSVFSRKSDQYSKILYEPRIILNTTAGTSRYFMITVPCLNSSGEFSIAGEGRFRFYIEEMGSNFARIEDLSRILPKSFDSAYLIVRETEHKDSWCRFFEDFPLLNVTLMPENCRNRPNCNCYIAEHPMAKIEVGNEVTEMVILFKEVVLARD